MKGAIYYTRLREETQKGSLHHMAGEKLLGLALRMEYGRDLAFEPRAKGEYGKPFFTLQPDIHYNISHSGKYVMCIFAGQPVGIDVQEHRSVRFEGILRRTVPEELAAEILSADNVEQAFYREWVRREAYIKWTGQGLSEDMRTLDMTLGCGQMLELENGYSGAVWSRSRLDLTFTEVPGAAELP